MRTYQKLMMLAAALLTAGTVAVNAQDFYYDDIYGESPKAKKKTGKATQTEATPSSSTRNVDEYNRRGSYKPVAGTSSVDSLGDNFEYTRRIERFYNPDVVSDADDPEVAYLYNYSNDELADATHKSPATINIYVDNSDPWNNFWSPYYYSSAWAWATTPGYYNPWWHYNYAWGYGPYWSLNWGWNHHWGWDWGWGPSWSWGPGWGPSWGWAPLPPHPGHGPSWSGNRPTSPGAWRPGSRNPNSSIRPGGTGGLRGSSSGRGQSSAFRPSSPNRGNQSLTGSGSRPSNGNSSGVRVGSTQRGSGGAYNPSNATRIGNQRSSGSGNYRSGYTTPSRGNSDTNRSGYTPSRGNSGGSRSGYSPTRNSGGSSFSPSRGNSGGTRSTGGGGGSRGGRR